jgi:transposase, IS5 family
MAMKPMQQSFLYQNLADTLNPRNSLYILAEKIPWNVFDKELSKYYEKFGRPPLAIRLMVSLLILKQMFDLSDEQLIRRWVENPYWQYFSGEEVFQWKPPCDSSELTVFRKRIGSKGAEFIFEVSAKMHGKKALEDEVVPDTTVQEKNITFPTDIKLHLKVARWCWKITDLENLELRQSYKRTLPKLFWQTRYIRRAKRHKEGVKAARKLLVRVGRILRDVDRNLSDKAKELYKDALEQCFKIVNQKIKDKNKAYSLHELDVSCISKGKEHKKFEFGSKVSIMVTKNSGIIVGAMDFKGNPYDGHTLIPQLEQYKQFFGKMPKAAIVDEGYRGREYVGETRILRVHKQKPKDYSKWQWKKRFRRRASVEPVIGHLKNDHRMRRNYLKGKRGDRQNLYLACAAFNFAKFIRDVIFWLKYYFKLIKANSEYQFRFCF